MEKVFRKSSLNSDLFTPSKTSECDQQKSQTSQSDHTLNISYLEEAASSWSKVPKSNRTTTDKDEVIELMKHERQRSPQPLPTKSNYTKHNETFWSITIQVFIPFLIAGMGMVAAGLVLGIVQVELANALPSIIQFICKRAKMLFQYSTGQSSKLHRKSLSLFQRCWDLREI